MVKQKWYECVTCNKTDWFCICEICIKNCHAGHDTFRKDFYGKEVCKCGQKASNCKSLKNEEPISKTLNRQEMAHLTDFETSCLPTQNSNAQDSTIISGAGRGKPAKALINFQDSPIIRGVGRGKPLINAQDSPIMKGAGRGKPLIIEQRSPIVGHVELKVEAQTKQEPKKIAEINDSESKNEKETKLCFECEDKASYDCLECEGNVSLCIDCYKPHKKKPKTRNHTLIPL